MIPARWLRLARAGWLAVALPTIGILVVGAVRDWTVIGALADYGWTPGSYRAALAQLGLQFGSLEFVYFLSSNLVRLGCVGVSLILFQRSSERMAFFTSLTLLVFSVTAAGVTGAMSSGPALAALVTFLQAFGQMCLMLFMFIFPTGRFLPPLMRWPTL